MVCNKHILEVKENKDTGDLYVELTSELLDRLKWKEGDNIDWSVQKDGSFILSKKNEDK